MSQPTATPHAPELRRSVSLTGLVLYGLGTTVGAGIYALTGAIAGVAGMWAWLSFALACAVAAPTALAFGELASRIPRSAGEAAYLKAGFGRRDLARAGGLCVALAGVTSAATLTHAAAGYLGVPIPPLFVRFTLVAVLGAIAAWGIRESVAVAGTITVLEVVGVLAVIAFAGWATPELQTVGTAVPWSGAVSGAALAFYAFLGFEDMVNVAEEVKQPRRTVPRAITIVLVATLVLYVALAVVAVRAVTPAELAASDAPLALLYARSGGPFPGGIRAIAFAGMLNGALVQIVMAARVLYGLSSQGELASVFARVHPTRRTPTVATATVVVAVIALGIAFPLEPLARLTSALTLTVFAAVNLALLRLKADTSQPAPAVSVPRSVAIVGAILSTALLVREVWSWLSWL